MAAAAAAAEPFAAVPEAILEQILLRLPSWASLVRAALVSKHWCGIISSSNSQPAFLVRYRQLHPSSPLLGFFSADRHFGLPAFRLADAVRSDPDLRAVQRGADLLLADLNQDSGWRIRDSRNGHLLLCRPGESGGDSFSVYNPVSHRLVTIPDRPHDRVGYFADCLLDFHSFRVVSVQQHRKRIRAVEYDPAARQWRAHPWQSPWTLDKPKKLKSWCLHPMQAAGLIFWKYSAGLALVLDHRGGSMQFSTCTVPASFYAIGEMEDGVGCLVGLDDPSNLATHGVLKVWLLNTGAGAITWELAGRKTKTVTKLLGPDTRVSQVVLVTNGLALISMDDRYDQFVIDLNKMSLHADFDFRGQAYPYQMEWPPARLPTLQGEAQPAQLVAPVEPATPLHDVDVAAPIDDVGLALDDVGLAPPVDDVGLAPPVDDVGLALDDVGLAAPVDDVGLALDDVGLAAPIDDLAYAEGPPAVVLRLLEEHGIVAETDNLVGTVEDGVRLMETEAAAPSADLVEGMAHSISTPAVPNANLGALSMQQPAALDEHLHEDASEPSNWFCTTCPGKCHKSTCLQHGALPTKPTCEGVVSSFRVDPPLVHAPCFPPMSSASKERSTRKFFGVVTYTRKVQREAMYAQKVNNSEEPPDMESDENQTLNEGHESLTAGQSVSTPAVTGGPPAAPHRERRKREGNKRYPPGDWALGHESLSAVQPVSTLADTGGTPAAAMQRERRRREASKRYLPGDWVLCRAGTHRRIGRPDERDAVAKG